MPFLHGKAITRRELSRRVGRLEQVAGVRLVTFGDGSERGVRALEFRTGSGFSFDVLVDRSMDVARCELNGRSLTWLSHTGVVGPWYAEPLGLGWFRMWGGGMLVTCGLDHTLLGGTDDASNFHQLVRPTEEYGLHGRIGFMPARLTGYGETWDGDECVLWAEGVVRQAAVYGEALELRRRIEARVGESRFNVHDQVTNVGFDPTSHMYLYHVNVGWPVVDAGAEYLVPAADGVPVAEYPTRDYRSITGPSAAFPEECYEHDTIPDADGRVPVAVVNRAAGLGAYQIYRKDQFRFHTMWRMLGEGTYGIAMEPTTNRDAGRFDAKERGELSFLQPGESRSYELEIGALDGEAAIESFAARVEKIKTSGAGMRAQA
jgi:hypothetical protein